MVLECPAWFPALMEEGFPRGFARKSDKKGGRLQNAVLDLLHARTQKRVKPMLAVTAKAASPEWALEPSKNPVDWMLWFDSNAARHWNTDGFVDLQENDPGEQGLSSAPGCLACVVAPRLDRWRAHKQDVADQFAQRKKEQLDKELWTLNVKVRNRAAVKIEAVRRQQGKEKPADTKVLALDQLQPTEADTAAFASCWPTRPI